jgi:hypothetical protein
MEEKPVEFDISTLENMNQKAIQNQFFVPDNVYMDLGLFKDLSLGAVFADLIFIKEDKQTFEEVQQTLNKCIKEYQKRKFDTVEPFLAEAGYTDFVVDRLLQLDTIHDQIFIIAPNTKFIQLLIRHTIRNQNNSRPANKYKKKKLDDQHFIMEPEEVTFRINTFPLTLTPTLLEKVAEEFGEAFGVNIVFMNKDPSLFDQIDWDTWMEKIDCFYLDSLGRFTKSPIGTKKQEDMQMTGIYVFARKRFEREVLKILNEIDFDHQVQMVTAYQGILCDFDWIQNNDLRLSEEADDVPMMDDNQTDTAAEST